MLLVKLVLSVRRKPDFSSLWNIRFLPGNHYPITKRILLGREPALCRTE